MALKESLVRGKKAQDEFEKKQDHLKEKYHVDEKENIIVVEKANMIKFFIRHCISLFHLIFQIALIILAIIGLLAIVYPTTRIALWQTMLDLQKQLITLLK